MASAVNQYSTLDPILTDIRTQESELERGAETRDFEGRGCSVPPQYRTAVKRRGTLTPREILIRHDDLTAGSTTIGGWSLLYGQRIAKFRSGVHS